MKTRCIYHVPYPIAEESNAASAIRPRKMLEAFQNNFDEVFVISGYGKERKQKFRELKHLIEKGVKFDFLYSENSTMPNLMTEKNHMPYYPLLELSIFKYCNKNNIPIGLFYRDVYWKFPVYKRNVNLFKRCITIPLYKYDMKIYNKYVDILYLPSNAMEEYVDFHGVKKPLPPGSESNKDNISYTKDNRILELFYVGGIGGDYDVSKLIESVRQCDFLHLTLCCHKDQWEKWLFEQKITIPSNITVIHKKGIELEEYYDKVDLGLLFFDSSGYRKMAMPFKLFEYIEHQIPVIATKDCAAGEFVQENNAGWVIPYDVESLIELTTYLHLNRKDLNEMRQNLFEVARNNSWTSRALSVYKDLTKG